MTSLSKIPEGTRAVFLDAGGTLFRPYPSIGHHYRLTAAKYGCRASEKDIEAAFHRVWSHHDRIGTLKSHMIEKNEKEFWREVVTGVFQDFGKFGPFDDFFNELYDLFARPEVWRFFPESEEVLRALKEKGYILCLVSNWDSRLVKLCEGLGLGRFMDRYVISSIFGAAKPDPRIFREALRLSGVGAHEAVHVGDSLEDDIHGAHQAGIRAIWLDRSGRHKGLAAHEREVLSVVKNLKELL
ncbi:MAG: Pyrimidine 5'-nucleotidase YjjG [Candidatus Omnitrophica bacterium ADurb.Bin292]|jgi:putative hydrolase of the HAD superfamily|nr:MAG: Pyrimidine 5'-nucleotidase YjjG [Candidatus Omnitrophica bacterium ADurb.Bin292]HOE68771.1 HAD-IA family hydrolase [Candidatus Omnitrophota bacterium]